MNDTTKPIQHDTDLLALLQAASQADAAYGRQAWFARFFLGLRSTEYRTDAEVVAALTALPQDERNLSKGASPAEVLVGLYERRQDVIDANSAVKAHEDAYTGWSRYFLVTSSDGLIHKSMSCSTCNKGRSMTEFALYASLSGTTHADAIKILGPNLCSVCYPEAPTEWTEQGKVSSKLAAILRDKGEAAFIAARIEAAEAAAVKQGKVCPGAGQPAAPTPGMLSRPYKPCAACGEYFKVTNGKVARHNKPKAGKA